MGGGREEMIGFHHSKILRLFLAASLIPLMGGCVTSEHWDETMNDPAQRFEIESEIRPPEQREYWERVGGNYGAWIFRSYWKTASTRNENAIREGKSGIRF
jgi:hypothetical protein